MKHKELAEQAGIGYLYEYEMKWAWLGELEVFAELVRADEREACAKLCEEVGDKAKDNDGYTIGGYACAKAIRARGNE
jgi:hypothetical protein